MKILGLITARGGSKRVPRKNVKEFLGKPLLIWSVETGKISGVFDRFILSTDDEEIAAIGKMAGIDVPFMRPLELATDTSGSFDVVKHAVEWLEEHDGFAPDGVILLEPTAPGRQAFHIREVARLLETTPTDSIVGISSMPGHFSPLKALARDNDGIVTRVGDGAILRDLVHRNQDIPPCYYINSALYAFKRDNLTDGSGSLWGKSTFGYLMEDKYAFDIDTLDDWIVAEAKMRRLINDK
jgi:CMP-N,N'-diacetyllegionaminic acid synthase